MADGTAPAPAGNRTIDAEKIASLAQQALCDIQQVDSLVSTSALALRQQNCEADSGVADVLEESAWGLIDSARQAIDSLLFKCGLPPEVIAGDPQRDEAPAAAVPESEGVHRSEDRWLDRALDEQTDVLFNAQAIVKACAGGIEEAFGAEMDSCDNEIPSFPRALLEAGRMIDRACGELEMMCLRARAVTLEVTKKND